MKSDKKFVRIDSKTLILVSRNISDEQARNDFNQKIKANERKFDNRQMFKKWNMSSE